MSEPKHIKFSIAVHDRKYVVGLSRTISRKDSTGYSIAVDLSEADRSVAVWGEQDRPIWTILSLETPLTLLSTLLSIRKIACDDIGLPPTSRMKTQASFLRLDFRVSIQPTSTCADLH
jgi:hypothetical protein